MKKKLMVMIPIGIGAIAIFTFVGGTAVKLLWNWLLPPLFGVPELTFWQALGMLALCRILFGGFGGKGSDSHKSTPEEKERFRQGMRRRFGWGSPSGECPPDTPPTPQAP
jgi:hypothetical protein